MNHFLVLSVKGGEIQKLVTFGASYLKGWQNVF
jgi:hypothetical protein